MPGQGCTGAFGRWSGMQDCIDEMVSEGHDQESAGAICQSIAQRASKGELYKATSEGLDIISKGDELVVGGYSTWELRDPQDDIITTKAQVGFLRRWFNLPREYQGITVKHGDFKIGEPIKKFTRPDGQTFYSHVNEIGTYLISKIRNDGFKTTALWREAILKGELGMYSISGLPLSWEIQKDGARRIDDLEPWAVTLCEHGVNPKAKTEVLAKAMKSLSVSRLEQLQKMTFAECVAEASKDPNVDDPEALCGWLNYHGPNAPAHHKGEGTPGIKYETVKITAVPSQIVSVERATEISKAQLEMETILAKHGFNKLSGAPKPILKSADTCDTSRCGGACCTFITDFSNRKDPDFIKYMQLHGVKVQEAAEGVFLKMPVPCKAFDPETKRCGDYENRPDLCRQYPRRPSPWISKEQCPLQP
jgi:hypothetical protein